MILKDFLNFKKSYPHFFKSYPQKKVELSTFFCGILCKPKNVDNFVDNFFKEWKN